MKAQTEDEIQEDIQLYEDDSPELARFLRKMEPLVLKELRKNKRSHAFDGEVTTICGLIYSFIYHMKSGVQLLFY